MDLRHFKVFQGLSNGGRVSKGGFLGVLRDYRRILGKY